MWAPPAATPDKVFEYECTGGESKKKKYRAYDDAQQRVLWEAYMRDDDDVEITIDSKYTYSIFLLQDGCRGLIQQVTSVRCA